MKRIGLTGGIGSGKTTVAKMFSKLGVPVYIADTEARKLTNSSKTIRRELTELLGEEAYLEGVLNRKFVADKIFNDKALLEAVNGIIHPKVAAHFNAWAAKQKSAYVIQEAAILFENGSYRNFDAIILVTAPKEIRIARVMARDNASSHEIEQRVSNQWSDEKKEKLADFIIENIDLEATQKRVENLHRSLS
ncbi:dephospho-CoA kinase [Aequorivita capsosiphonis]|uniref:dephospho-CoA kinase n=1 Tax=Aequorivita capsosiphonis TaxID=487317 RepID=UPI00047EFA7C|nr:dephospho-CoA kinase [Aequorivita capsosiphonis]